MSILVFSEDKEQIYQLLGKASELAQKMGGEVYALASDDPQSYINHGANKVLHVSDTRFDKFDSGAFAKAISQAAQKTGAEVVINVSIPCRGLTPVTASVSGS